MYNDVQLAATPSLGPRRALSAALRLYADVLSLFLRLVLLFAHRRVCLAEHLEGNSTQVRFLARNRRIAENTIARLAQD